MTKPSSFLSVSLEIGHIHKNKTTFTLFYCLYSCMGLIFSITHKNASLVLSQIQLLLLDTISLWRIEVREGGVWVLVGNAPPPSEHINFFFNSKINDTFHLFNFIRFAQRISHIPY